MNIEALVAPIRADATSGAATLARSAATVLELAALEAPADSAADLAATLTSLVLAVLDAQPSMAPLVALAREVIAALNPEAALQELRRSAATAAVSFREAKGLGAVAAAKSAAEALPAGPILTLSYSSTVQDAFLESAKHKEIRVLCLESRPLNEGHAFARELADAGVTVTLAVDAAADSLLAACAAVLIGADSVGDRGVVNKIGSAAVARGAAHYGLPLLVAADSSKLLPVGFPHRLGGNRPPDEVWTAPKGARVWNRYFEAFPVELVTNLFTEEGALDPAGITRRRSEIAVPNALAAWAAAQP